MAIFAIFCAISTAKSLLDSIQIAAIYSALFRSGLVSIENEKNIGIP